MVDQEREFEMEWEGDSNEVSGSPTTQFGTGTVMDYEMGLMFSSLSPLVPSFDYSVSLRNSPSPGHRPQSPEFEISLRNFPSPSRWPSPEPGFSRLITSYGNASSSTQPLVRSPSPPFHEQGDLSLLRPVVRLQDLSILQRLQLCCLLCLQDLSILKQLLLQELARLYSLSNEKRELHKFIQNASQITLQIKIKMAHEICKEGHDNTSIEILDKMTVATDVYKLHFSWTKALCRHRSQNNANDLKKSCTSFDGCYKHQDCMSTVKLEICIDFYVDDMEIFQKLFSSHMPFFCSEYTLVCYGGKIESQRFHAICEPIASADDEPDSRCELTHISHCTRSPPGPNGLPDGEEMLQQDSPKHQLMGETHAMNDGENVLSYGGIHSAVSYPENERTRKTPKRKITIEDLQHFSGSRNDAVNHFGVSVPTIKRCLRDHKIKGWWNRNIDKNNQCLSEPKEIMESFPGEEAEMGNQMAGGSRSCEREFNHEQIGSDRSQIGVGTRLESSPMGNMFASSAHELCVEAGDHSELPVQPSELNLSATRLEPDAVNSPLPQIPERELLMENSGSSRELSDHYISATEAFNAKQVPDSSWTNLSCSDPAPKLANTTAAHMMQYAKETQDTRIVTVKAKYRDVMVKFKLPLTSGIIELNKEVAKKQELEVDSFSIKYLDDENEWIVMKDDVDL